MNENFAGGLLGSGLKVQAQGLSFMSHVSGLRAGVLRSLAWVMPWSLRLPVLPQEIVQFFYKERESGDLEDGAQREVSRVVLLSQESMVCGLSSCCLRGLVFPSESFPQPFAISTQHSAYGSDLAVHTRFVQK